MDKMQKVVLESPIEVVFRGCLAAEQGLVEATSPIVRYLFLATNIPFWLLVIEFSKDGFDSLSTLVKLDVAGICNSPTAFIMMSVVVALASTAMHTVQLRLVPSKQTASVIYKVFHCDCSSILNQETIDPLYKTRSQ